MSTTTSPLQSAAAAFGDAAHAADQTTTAALADLAKRVAILEAAGGSPLPVPPVPPSPPVTTESPEGAEVTATSTVRQLVDAAGTVYTLVGGQLAIGGKVAANTDSIVRIRMVSHAIWQQVIKTAYPGPLGHWWSLTGTGTWAEQGTAGPPGAPPFPYSPPPPPVVVPPTPIDPNADFNCAGGQILLGGKRWSARGVCILESTIANVVRAADCTPLLAKFPGTNCVRIAMESGYGPLPGELQNAIIWLTAKRIAVQIGQYNTTGGVASGQGLTDEVNWIGAIANTYKANPFVWFSTDNEPREIFAGAVTQEQKAFINAIRRGAGNTSMIGIDDSYGKYDPSVYQSEHKLHWDSHYYPANANNSLNVADHVASIKGRNAMLRGLFQSADGIMPIMDGEFGDSTGGDYPNSGGAQAVQAVLQVSGAEAGWTAWIYYWPGNKSRGMMGDELTNEDTGVLTPYGQQIAAGIAAGATF
jgi:hypothetical protein